MNSFGQNGQARPSGPATNASTPARALVLRAAALFGLCATFLMLDARDAPGGTFPGDNGRIVFSADQFTAGDAEIYTMTAGGSGLTQLTSTTGSNNNPSWSADGTKIAFNSTRDGDVEIYGMNGDGSGQTRLTTMAGDDGSPSWSADGTKIAFYSDRVTVDNPTGDLEIFVMSADGSAVTQLTDNTIQDASPSFSPDGTKIAFDRDVNDPSEIWTMNPDGSDQTLITYNSNKQNVGPRWSPDSAKILWLRDFGSCSQADIWVMDAGGTSPSAVICSSGHDSGGTYSPDGTKILFGSTRDAFGGIGKEEIYIANADGSAQTRMTTTTYNETGYDWQAVNNYPRPGSATPFRVPLVPAYSPCSSPNSTHAAPVDEGSCSPPTQVSSTLTTGVIGQMSAFARFAVVVGNPATYEDEADVNILVNVTDVRCQATNAACPGGAGSEYIGKALVTSSIRITDKASYGAGGKATVLDDDLEIPVDCTSTPSTSLGSKCTASTSGDAVLPGMNQEGRNAITEVLSVKLKDPGPNGTGYDAGCPPTCGDGDEAIFLGQGWFVP